MIVNCNASFESVSTIKNCQSDQWFDPNTKECIKCASNCKLCFNTICMDCMYGKKIDGQSCLLEDQLCDKGQYFDQESKSCLKCQIPFCLKCSGETQCKECQVDFLNLNGKCIWEKMSSKDPNVQKEVENLNFYEGQDGSLKLSEICPLDYYEDSAQRTCYNMKYQVNNQYTVSSSNDENTYSKILFYQLKNLIILIADSEINLIQRNQIQNKEQILSLKSQTSTSENDNEKIQTGFLFLNLVFVFTNKQILAYDLRDNKLTAAYGFIQGDYKFNSKSRMLIDYQKNRINYLHYDKDNKDLYLSVFELTYSYQGGMAFNLKISQLGAILINIIEKTFSSITYLFQHRYIVVTTQNNVYFIFDQELVSDESLKLQEWKDNFQKFYIMKRMGIYATSVLDDCESDQTGIYILRHQQKSFNLIKLEISVDEKQVKDIIITQSLFNPTYYKLKSYLFRSSPENDLSRLIILVQVLDQLGQEYADIQINQVEFCFEKTKLNLIRKYRIMEQAIYSESDLFYTINPKTKQQIIIYNMKYKFGFLFLDDVSQNLDKSYLEFQEKNNQISLSLGQLAAIYDNQSQYDQELIIPYNSNQLISLFIAGTQINIKYSSFISFSDKDDLFYISKKVTEKQVGGFKTYVDEKAQIMFFYQQQLAESTEANFYNQFYLTQIDLQRNQLQSFKIFDFKQGSFYQNIIQVELFSSGQALILINIVEGIYLIEYHTLKVIKYLECVPQVLNNPKYVIIKFDKLQDDHSYIAEITVDDIIVSDYFNKIGKIMEPEIQFQGDIFLYKYQIEEKYQYHYDIVYQQNLIERIILPNQSFSNPRVFKFINQYEYALIYLNEDTSYYELFRYKLQEEGKSFKAVLVNSFIFSNDNGYFYKQSYFESYNVQFIITNEFEFLFLGQEQTDYNQIYIEVFDLKTFKRFTSIEYPNTYLYSEYIILQQGITYDSFTQQFQINLVKKYFLGKLYSERQQYIYQLDLINYKFSAQYLAYFEQYYNDGARIMMQNEKFQVSTIYNSVIVTSDIGYSQVIQIQNEYSKQYSEALFYDSNKSQASQVQNIVYNNNLNSVFILNAPNANHKLTYSNKYEQYNKSPQWVYSQSLECIISMETFKLLSLKKIFFLQVDNLELLFEEITCNYNSQIFWFDEIRVLVILQQQTIQSYIVQSGRLIAYNTLKDIQNVDFDKDESFHCIKSNLHQLILCSALGIYIVDENILIENSSIKLEPNLLLEPIIKENNKYVLFGNNKIYTISDKIIESINLNSLQDIKNIQLSQKIDDQGFHQTDETDCIVFSLPGFNVIQQIKDNHIFGTTDQSIICKFNPYNGLVLIYYNQLLKSYKLPFPYSALSISESFSIKIEESEVYFMNSGLQQVGKLCIGQYKVQSDSFNQKRNLFVVDTEEKTKHLYQGFETTTQITTLNNFWLEKNLLFTSQGFVSLTDVSLQINFRGQDEFRQRQTIGRWSTNYNYIIQESPDQASLVIIDVSQLFPISKSNSITQNRFQTINVNLFDIIENSLENSIQSSLIYYDYEQNIIIRKKYLISLSDSSSQIINEIIQKETILDLKEISFEKNSELQYKIFSIDNIGENSESTYLFKFQCMLIVFKYANSQQVILDKLDLTSYNCKLWGGESINNGYTQQQYYHDQSMKSDLINKFFLIKNKSTIIHLIVELNKLKLIEVSTTVNGQSIQNIYIWRDQKASDVKIAPIYILVSLQDQNDQFNLIKITSSFEISELNTAISGEFISSINMVQLQNQLYLLVGTNTSLRIYTLTQSTNILQSSQVSKFDIGNRGQVYSIMLFDLSIITNINIILITKSRIVLLYANFIDPNSVKTDFAAENLIHTRQTCYVKGLQNNSIIAVFDRLQVMLYFPNLTLLGRIEEPENKYIRNVQLAPDGQTIVVQDLDSLFIYNIRTFTESKKFILQKAISYSIPTIYHIFSFNKQISSTTSDYLLLLFGHHLKGSLCEKYYPKYSNSDLSQGDSVSSYNKNIMSIDLPQLQLDQEKLYKNILNDDQGFELIEGSNSIYIKHVYFNIQNDISILIPTNLIGTSNSYSTKQLDIRINLNNKICHLRQYSVDDSINYVSSMQIQNGKIIIESDIYFYKSSNIILSNVQIQFKNGSIKFVNAKQILFNQLFLQNESILNKDRMTSVLQKDYYMPYQPLIEFKDTTNVKIFHTNVLKAKYQKDVFVFSNCENVNINNFRVQNSIIAGSIFIFNQKTKNIKIQNLKLIESTILQLLSIYQAKQLELKQLMVMNVKSIISEETRLLEELIIQNSKNNDRILEQNSIYLQQSQNYYGSFIVAQLISKETILENITFKQNTHLNVFLQYQNFYQFIDTGSVLSSTSSSGGTKKQIFSNKSTLTIKQVYIEDTTFEESYGFSIIETRVSVQDFLIINSQNPSISIQNARKGLNMNRLTYQKNTLNNQPIIKVENSIIKCSVLELNENKLQNKAMSISVIELYNSDYSFEIVKGDKNEFTSSFLFIKDELIKESSSSPYEQNFLQKKSTLKYFTIKNSDMRAIYILDQESLSILNSSFISNNIKKIIASGGAISLIRIKLMTELLSVNIKNNYAIMYGGGLYLEDSNLKLVNCQIEQNEALIGGGLRYSFKQHYFNFYFLNDQNFKTQIKNNIAPILGKNYGSYPKKIKIISDLNDVPSSVNQNSFSVIFQLYGEDGELVTFNEKDYSQPQHENVKEAINKYLSFYLLNDHYEEQIGREVLIQEKNSDSEYQNSRFNLTVYIAQSNYDKLNSESQSGNLEQINKYLSSQPRQILKIQSSAWASIEAESQLMPFILEQKFDIRFKYCEEGEVIQQIQEKYYYCFSCQDNTFSLGNPYLKLSTPDQNQCKQCPLGSSFCRGSVIIPQEEYWNDIGTSYVGYCENQPQKCTQKYSVRNKARKDQIQNLEDIIETSNGCSEGGFGPLCESCDYEGVYWTNEEGFSTFAKKNSYECRKCGNVDDNLNQYILPTLLIIIFILYVTYQIFSNAYHKINKLKAYLLRCSSLIIVSRTLNEREKISIILKIIISYIQIVSIIQQFHLNIPEQLRQIIFFIGDVLDISFYYLDCMFIDLKMNKDIKMIYLRLIWTIVSPILYFILLLIIGYFLQKKMHLIKRKRNLLISGILQFYYMIYPGLIKQSIGTIWCKSINGKSYTLLDTQYECSGKDYIYFNIFLSAPLLIMTLLIPLFIYKQIKKNQFKLMSVSAYLNYGFFYGEYQKDSYFWEIIRIYHKMFVFCIVSIFNQSSTISGIMVSLSIIFYMKVLQIQKPYIMNRFNRLELFSQITAVMTIFCAIMNTHSTSEALEYISLAIIIILNGLFFLQCFISLTHLSFHNSSYTTITLFLEKIKAKYPILFSADDNQVNNILRVTKNWKSIQSFIRSFRSNNIKPFSNFQSVTEEKELLTNQVLTNHQLLNEFSKQQPLSMQDTPKVSERLLLNMVSSPQSGLLPLSDQNLIEMTNFNSPRDIFSPINNPQIQSVPLTQNPQPTINSSQSQADLQSSENFEEQIHQIVLNPTKEIQKIQEEDWKIEQKEE